MRTIKIRLYKYSELGETAKERAKRDWEYDNCFERDRTKSYFAACKIYDRIDQGLTGIRLYKYIVNNILPDLTAVKKYCEGGFSYYTTSHKTYTLEKHVRFSQIFEEIDPGHLTGYCSDYVFLKPLFDFLKNPVGDLTDVDIAAMHEKERQNDYNAFYEEDIFAEHMEANDYEFTIDGKFYTGRL